MAKKTLLKLVQDIGEAIEADEIDELDETLEASTIMNILIQTYDEVLDRRDWEFLRDRVVTLDAREVGNDKYNDLLIPTNVTAIQCLRYYGTNNKFVDLQYMQPCDFVAHVQARNAADTNVTVIPNDDGVALNILNDTAPTFYTSFDEEAISFDAYDSTRGLGNQPADSVIVGNIKPTVDFTDPTATLPIPERMQSLVFNEAVATANYRLRQTADPRSERLARRQGIKMRELEPRTQRDKAEVNYGRRTSSGR